MMEKKAGYEHEKRCPTRNEIGQDPVAKAVDLPTGDIVGVTDHYQDNGDGAKILKRSQMHTLSLTRFGAVAPPKSTPHADPGTKFPVRASPRCPTRVMPLTTRPGPKPAKTALKP